MGCQRQDRRGPAEGIRADLIDIEPKDEAVGIVRLIRQPNLALR